MTRRLTIALAAALLAVSAGCTGDRKGVTTTAATTPAISLFTGSARRVTFAEARTAIRRLYAHHPEIRNFVYQDVYYSPETRDKVLTVCSRGGPAGNARELETSRVFGCAPLIFFFYSFGTRKRVAESVDVARTLYRYAADIRGPYDPQPGLTALLRGWGIR